MQPHPDLDQVLSDFMVKHRLHNSFYGHAQKWFIPLAEQIIAHQNSAKKPFFIGVNGCQGSGKSTLTDFLKAYIEHQTELSVLQMSLDDFYLSKSERMALAVKVHPLLKTRGVPGTHNTQSMFNILNTLTNQQTGISVPQFDKSTDDPKPVDQWLQITHVPDIVLFEGWCWGVAPQPAEALETPVNQLESEEDENGVWRQYVNSRLTQDYLPLYEYMNYWVMLKAPSFDNVLGWRIEQEQKLKASLNDSSEATGLMSEQQITRFIQHYQRLTQACLTQLPCQCDVVFELDSTRDISNKRTLNAS